MGLVVRHGFVEEWILLRLGSPCRRRRFSSRSHSVLPRLLVLRKQQAQDDGEEHHPPAPERPLQLRMTRQPALRCGCCFRYSRFSMTRTRGGAAAVLVASAQRGSSLLL